MARNSQKLGQKEQFKQENDAYIFITFLTCEKHHKKNQKCIKNNRNFSRIFERKN